MVYDESDAGEVCDYYYHYYHNDDNDDNACDDDVHMVGHDDHVHMST